ncbi:uncharacterized protein (TIGR00297 family) [Fontibacillus phaseoli]|uniref:Uncharacterized protein (TIGR00297 family) n=1 Tax=Fontibacillus phaseoli TaxID=1416533 RepID=A0A369BJH2_9BACL|nr:DUF92 domain-containing protein [Fontibacillus phaseoli]RCX21749.1 uncharacterized protein (TIGR00297 family) [Fontibacillus phaseoli]
MSDWIIGALCALLVSAAAYWKRSLSLSGMIAAAVMGTVYYGAGNPFWFGILLLFFITSTLFSKFRGNRKRELEKSYAKSGRRDAGQVLANGGLGMVACIGNAIWPDPLWAYVFVGVMGAVTADTWATEWGGLSRKPPRSVLTWKPLPAGTSGGVSPLGSFAALLGAIMIGGAAWMLLGWTGGESEAAGSETISSLTLWQWIVVGGLSGFAGAFADSLLGATLQRMNLCPVCGKSVEVETHCGVGTLPARGFRWMNNDAVNMLSSLAAGFIAWGLAMLLI